VAGDDVHVICCTSDPLPIKALAVIDLAITVVPGADATKLLEVGVKGAAKAGGEQAAFALVRWIAGKTDGKVAADLSDNALRDAFRARETGGLGALRDAVKAVGCALCFPAGTLVSTTHGEHVIQTLHVGDLVQSENPATGKVEAEAVQAIIQDPVSPLVAVDLSDGSAITVTADHPFWVDAGAQLAGAGWFAAGSLQAGDELRTASGAPVMVVGLRRNVGSAVVYTLTVAMDHTFFVGSARVLVHNANCSLTRAEQLAINRIQGVAAESRVEQELVSEGATVLGSQISIRTRLGIRRVDILAQLSDGSIVAVEVKSGGAVRSTTQVAKDEIIAIEGGTLVGKNAPTTLRGRILTLITLIRH